MSWETIIGHDHQIRVLKKAFATGRLAHAYLFAGPEGSGKETVAFEVASILNCRTVTGNFENGACGSCQSCRQVEHFMHPNIEYLFPVESVLLEPSDLSKKENKRFSEAKERYDALLEQKKRNPYFSPSMERSMGILTEQVVMLQQKAALSPREGGKKVFIVSQAERLHPSAANKLLKLLEEPPPHVVFILVSSRPEAVLPTIRSRCQLIMFSKIKPAELRTHLGRTYPDIIEPELSFIVNFSRGNLGIVHELASNRDRNASAPSMILLRNQALDFLRNILTPQRFHEAISLCEEISKNLSRYDLVIFLASLLLFFQDVCHRRIDPAFTGINNPDIAVSVDRFVRGFPHCDLYGISSVTEEAIRSIERNANPLLVLAGFTAEIKALLQPS
jgi:DNA polymerase-3 subunit delta'